MKLLKSLATVILVVFFADYALAFDPATDCQTPLLSMSMPLSKINNYKTKGILKDGIYILCFDSKVDPLTPVFKASATINVNPSDPLLIYGLNLSVKEGSTPTSLLTLSGPNITLDHVTITSNVDATKALQINANNITVQDSVLTSNGTALGIADGLSGIIFQNIELQGNNTLFDISKVSSLQGTNKFTTTGTGPVIAIPANYGAFTLANATLIGPSATDQSPMVNALEIPAGVNATIGPNVSFEKFATGINIKQGATANITQNKFTNVTEPIYWEIPFWTADPISVEWFGKHISDADVNAVDRIAGKIDLTCPSEIPACAGMTCGGSVEMYSV